MDGNRFDDLTKALAAGASRRGVLRGLAAAAAGAGLTLLGRRGAEAACRNFSRPCEEGDRCCRGAVCRGGACTCPPDKLTCQSMSSGTRCVDPCPIGQVLGADCRCLCVTTLHRPVKGKCPCSEDDAECRRADECCSGFCNTDQGVCSGSCTLLGGECLEGAECCSRVCSEELGQCVRPCRRDGASCTEGAECCSGFCDGKLGECGPSCLPDGEPCGKGGECCGFCYLGSCCSGLDDGQQCGDASQCCSGICDGICFGLK
jgi:hypothetical protein